MGIGDPALVMRFVLRIASCIAEATLTQDVVRCDSIPNNLLDCTYKQRIFISRVLYILSSSS